MRARLLVGSVLQSDETSVRVDKKNWWLWAFHHGADCCFIIRASRGKDVVADFLGEVRPPSGLRPLFLFFYLALPWAATAAAARATSSGSPR